MTIMERINNIRKSGVKNLPLELETVSPDIFQLVENFMEDKSKYDVGRVVFYSKLENWNAEDEFYYLDKNKNHIIPIKYEELKKIVEEVEEQSMETMLNFEELKEKYPMLTEEKFKALLSGKRDILLISTEDYDDYYSIHHGKLISTKFVDKKNLHTSIHMEDDLI